jgi:hypothetical protein
MTMAKTKNTPALKLEDARDYRDAICLGAVKAAITLIDDADEADQAACILRLVRDRLEQPLDLVHG